MSKVLTIGIDGLEPSLVKKWLADLPNLRRFTKEGMSGKLKSVEPPVTIPAWPSFYTGKNPGKFGVFSFYRKKENELDYELVDRTFVKADSLWKILSRKGKRSIVLNVPLTYPPERIRGILVSGMFTPSNRKNFVYPARIGKKLIKIFPDYIVGNLLDKALFPQTAEGLVEALKNMVDKRTEVMKFLLKNYQWDLAMLVYNASDIVSHFYFGNKDKKDNPVKEIYQHLDGKIGELMELANKETVFVLMSDHGFRSMKKGEFYINTWLEKEGFIKRKKRRKMKSGQAGLKVLFRILQRMGMVKFLGKIIPEGTIRKFGALRFEIFSDKSIDWKRTIAYSIAMGDIFINLGDKTLGSREDYERIREKLIKALKKIKAPKTGTPVVDKISKKEDLYHGKFLDLAPDLVFSTEKSGFHINSHFSFEIFGPSERWQGDHGLYGMYGFWGKNIRRKTRNAEIVDLAPTILTLLGVKVPPDMDGKTISLFKK